MEMDEHIRAVAISCTLTVHFGALFFKKTFEFLAKSSFQRKELLHGDSCII